MGGRLEVLVLGPVEARVDAQQASLGGPRQRALLGLLATAPGAVAPAARLADELWQGRPPQGAGTTLRSYVSRLRTALGRDAVEGRAGGYALLVESEAIDAQRFERLAVEAQSALADGAAGRAAERATAALALWRGTPFTGTGDCDALAAEQRRLEELRLGALETRIDADLELGRHDALVAELQALVRDEPLRERLWRQLVLALYRAGRQADGLAAYREARALLDRELGLEPGDELRDLERAILRGEVEGVRAAGARHNLPVAATPLVGRARELDDVARLLRRNRLVTVTGMGGSGKTRLASEAARRQVDAWNDGVWLVDLTAVGDPALVPGAVAAALGLVEPSADQLEALRTHLRSAELLLLLDNCEHVVAACAELAETLLRGCANVRILATSRVALAVAGEADYALEPLADDDALRLFLDRVREVRHDLPVDDAALAVAGSICRELDGLPLALELAAARAKTLSLGEIGARLDDRFRFLRAWRRVADPRHRTLETTMDWSYDLLAPAEQALLRRLGVFAGGADLDAIAAVCFDGDEPLALDTLGRLVDASLVQVSTGEVTRYRLLETVRQYAAAKLDEDPAVDAVRRAHAEHYLRVADDANLSIERLGHGPQDLPAALREQHNMRAALDWAAGHDVPLGLELAIALENFWITQAVVEGEDRYDDMLTRAEGAGLLVLARAHRDRAACADVLGDVDTAAPHYARSRELFAEAGDVDGVGSLTFRFGLMAMWRDDLDEARRLFEECLETFRATGYRVGTIQALSGLGEVEIEQGDEAAGLRLIDEALELAREIGWHWWEARALADRAAHAVAHGRGDEAEAKARPFLEYAWRTSNRQEILYGLAILARAAALRGEDEQARLLWSTVDAAESGVGRFGHFDRAEYADAIPAGPLPPPLPLADAVATVLNRPT